MKEDLKIELFLKWLEDFYPELKELLLKLKGRLGKKTWIKLIIHLDEFSFRCIKLGEENVLEDLYDW